MATLRITKIKQEPSLILLKVEGAVVGECVGVLKEECKGWHQKNQTVQLDFSGVTSLSPEGIEMLRGMPPTLLQVIKSPEFIHHLLNFKEQG